MKLGLPPRRNVVSPKSRFYLKKLHFKLAKRVALPLCA